MAFFDRLFQLTPKELIIWTAACAGLVAVGWYLLGLIRSQAAKSEPSASELLSSYRDLHDQGEISESEYREIKTVLASRLRAELDNAEDDPKTGE